MSADSIILTGHKLYEKIDDKTKKVLCVTCGGKGFYLLCSIYDHKGELVSCDCENGFKYKAILKNHGKRQS